MSQIQGQRLVDPALTSYAVNVYSILDFNITKTQLYPLKKREPDLAVTLCYVRERNLQLASNYLNKLLQLICNPTKILHTSH